MTLYNMCYGLYSVHPILPIKYSAKFANVLLLVVVVVIPFLSSVVGLAEMAGFTPSLLQLLALRLSTCLVSGHPPSNQSSLILLHLLLPGLLRSSSLSLATHFKIHSNSQNIIVIPPRHMSIPSDSVRCC